MTHAIDSQLDEPALHPIQVVARRTGLSPDLIRAWERRYQAVSPRRSTTDRRLYSDTDVERLQLLRRAIQSGRRIGDVAQLSLAALQALAQRDEARQEPSTGRAVPATPAADYLDACLTAVRRLDPFALDAALAAAARALSVPALLREVIGELLARIGEAWRVGELRACHEHMATVQVRFFLGALLFDSMMTTTGPVLLVTTPRGQRHELGALMVAVTAAQAGWLPLYLGPDMPSDEIAFAAGEKNAVAVALSISYPADDPRLAEALRRLRRQLAESVAIVVGGAAVAGYREALAEIGALCPPDLSSLRATLEQLRQ